jgi:UDP-N-acetylglucosamine 2-epimerase (non-hydrolysing)
MQNITFRDNFWEDLEQESRKNVHLVMIGTKPDIIKQAPIYLELKKRNELVLLCHTGQHYDFNLSGGLVEEFGVTPDFNLNIKGMLHQNIAQIIERLGDIFAKMKEMGKTAIPYVHGDTMTAMAASNAAWSNGFAAVHVEAGIRTLTPKKEIFQEILADFNWDDYYQNLQDRNNWERGSIEPYPEQYNTRCAEPATGLHCAPVELDREFMLAEGCMPDRIKVVGNSVYDATKIAEENAQNSTIFEKYPLLEKGGFVRFCIHRRENTSSKERFTVLFESIEKLVQENIPVLLISLFQTEAAIDNFNLRSRVEELKKQENFIYSEVWPYYTDVIAAMKKAACCATDSGSMQEEMNILSIPCVTLRFGSDRSESIIAGANMIAPPVDSDLIVQIIKGAMDNEDMKKVPNLYGENVSAKIVDEVLTILEKDGELFRFEQGRLGLS